MTTPSFARGSGLMGCNLALRRRGGLKGGFALVFRIIVLDGKGVADSHPWCHPWPCQRDRLLVGGGPTW